MDDNNHGTHVAGTIAAVGNNQIGVVGVLHSAKLLGCKFLNSNNSGWTSNALECLNYAVMYSNVSNNSWGGGKYLAGLNDAINRNPQYLFIASAGNNSNHDRNAYYPCDYVGALCVASTDQYDRYSSFSDYGNAVDVAAPGSSIYSTLPRGRCGYMSGTS